MIRKVALDVQQDELAQRDGWTMEVERDDKGRPVFVMSAPYGGDFARLTAKQISTRQRLREAFISQVCYFVSDEELLALFGKPGGDGGAMLDLIQDAAALARGTDDE